MASGMTDDDIQRIVDGYREGASRKASFSSGGATKQLENRSVYPLEV